MDLTWFSSLPFFIDQVIFSNLVWVIKLSRQMISLIKIHHNHINGSFQTALDPGSLFRIDFIPCPLHSCKKIYLAIHLKWSMRVWAIHLQSLHIDISSYMIFLSILQDIIPLTLAHQRISCFIPILNSADIQAITLNCIS